jgi:hypothetical protein
VSPLPLPWVPDTICETHEWRSALGETIRFVTRTEAVQRMMPPVSITTLKVPQAQGGRFRGARHEERLATIPVVVPGPVDGRDELRRWAAALDPLKGEGTLTVVQGPHAGRQLTCTYEAGLESYAEEFGLLGLTTLAFRAAEPYWQDVNAWPIATVVGPGTELTVRNDTTGLAWRFEGDMLPDSTLVVDHRPGHKSARLDGFNAFGRLAPDSALFPLVPGPNRISIGFATGTIASSVRFAWRNRWLAA